MFCKTRRGRLRYGVRALGLITLLFLVYVNSPSDGVGFSVADVYGSALAPLRRNWAEFTSNADFGPPVQPGELATCFKLVVAERPNVTRGNAAAIVSLAALTALADRDKLTLAEASAAALYGVIEGGANHVVLVPGAAEGWSAEAVTSVRDAVSRAEDQHGVALLTAFSAVPPTMVQCLGVGDTGAGVAWAVAAGAPAVVDVAEPSPVRPVSLRFPTATARFLVQVASPGFAEPPLAPLRKHFQACGGAPTQCDPLPDALQV